MHIESARQIAYEPVAHLNRADRRTAAGRVKMVEAENRFLKAKLAILEEHKETGA